MMAFRSKKTVAQLARVFHISEVIKGKRFDEDLKTDVPVRLEIQKNNYKHQVSPNNQPTDYKITLDISDSKAITQRFGVVEPGTSVRQSAEDRIFKIGKDLGFNSYTWYEVPNLLNDGRTRFISVVWMTGKDIEVAFQVRKRRRNPHITMSLKDRRKLHHLPAKEKYIVNVSEKTGRPYFFRVTDSDNKDLLERTTESKPEKAFSIQQNETKTYSLEEIRKKYPRAYESWTENEDDQLISQYNEKLTIREIANRHQRQRGAIRARLIKLGLVSRK
jgi:hypothetical protein